MDGLLIIDKPEGMTSAEVVRRVKHRLRCKTGHLGTLDPFATGVLPVCVGDGTKVAQFLNEANKEYTGVIRLGSATATGDRTGTVTSTAAIPALDLGRVDAVAQRFVGESAQTPPMYSAIKQHGTPLYKLARQGITVERKARRIHIDTLRLTMRDDTALDFFVACSKGTYIRVLAEEIAVALGSVGHLEALRRVGFGHFRIAAAVSLDAIEQGARPLIGLREALRDFPEIRLDAATARRARQGYAPVLTSLRTAAQHETATLVDPDDKLVAVLSADDAGRWRFARVFADAEAAAS